MADSIHHLSPEVMTVWMLKKVKYFFSDITGFLDKLRSLYDGLPKDGNPRLPRWSACGNLRGYHLEIYSSKWALSGPPGS